MTHRLTRLDRLLQRKRGELEGLARRANRWSWGSAAIEYDDYLQQAYLTAIEIYRRHASKKDDQDIERMIHKGVVYSLWRTWHSEVTRITATVELSTEHIDLESEVFKCTYFSYVMQEAELVLNELEYEMLRVLVMPNCDVTCHLCYDLFKVVPHRPIQIGEFHYLTAYFDLPLTKVQELYYDIRRRLTPILEAVA